MTRLARIATVASLGIVTGIVIQCSPGAVRAILDGSPDAHAEVDSGGICDCAVELEALGTRLESLEERLDAAEAELEDLGANPGAEREVVSGIVPDPPNLELPLRDFDGDEMPAVQLFVQGAGGELAQWSEAELVIRADGTVSAPGLMSGRGYRLVVVR